MSNSISIVAKSENRDVSFLGTFASEIVGVEIGIEINIASNHKGVGRWTPVILPLTLPIIYVELFE